MADRFLFLYMTAITQALEMIKAGLVESKGKLGPLLAEYKGREEVKRAVAHFPEPTRNCEACREGVNYVVFEDRKWDHAKPPGCAALCPVKGQPTWGDKSFPVCLTSLQPIFGGVTWVDWIVPAASPGYTLEQGTPNSNLGPTGFTNYGTMETPRPESQCTHQDSTNTLNIGADGPVVFKIPKTALKQGVLGACVLCGNKGSVGSAHPWDLEFAPIVHVQAPATATPVVSRLDWLNNQTAFSFDAGLYGNVAYPKKSASCWTLADRLPLNQEALVHVECPAGMAGKMQYLWVW